MSCLMLLTLLLISLASTRSATQHSEYIFHYMSNYLPGPSFKLVGKPGSPVGRREVQGPTVAGERAVLCEE